MKRFVLVILDGFGVGCTNDAAISRPQDVNANTSKHILENYPELKLVNLEKLGLMNILNFETHQMKKNSEATYGISHLAHSGADTFYGHQEIMGTKTREPIQMPFCKIINEVYHKLIKEGFSVEFRGENLKYLLVNGCVTIADNIEADPGSAYNVTAALDFIDFETVVKIGKIVRSVAKVSRVIAFGGYEVSIEDISSAVEEKDEYIGINAPKSGVYNKGYKVVHLGYGVSSSGQAPTILGAMGIDVRLIGKVADIVLNEFGKSISCVDTEETMELALNEFLSMSNGFLAVNVQETDLAGHAQDTGKYAEKLLAADKYIGEIIDHIKGEDLLVVMADHGNDPTIGHSHHTRENVPILIYGQNIKKGSIGYRTTMSDVGKTITNFFKCPDCENGTSFLEDIYRAY